jgi:hypothetical protein
VTLQLDPEAYAPATEKDCLQAIAAELVYVNTYLKCIHRTLRTFNLNLGTLIGLQRAATFSSIPPANKPCTCSWAVQAGLERWQCPIHGPSEARTPSPSVNVYESDQELNDYLSNIGLSGAAVRMPHCEEQIQVDLDDVGSPRGENGDGEGEKDE